MCSAMFAMFSQRNNPRHPVEDSNYVEKVRRTFIRQTTATTERQSRHWQTAYHIESVRSYWFNMLMYPF